MKKKRGDRMPGKAGAEKKAKDSSLKSKADLKKSKGVQNA